MVMLTFISWWRCRSTCSSSSSRRTSETSSYPVGDQLRDHLRQRDRPHHPGPVGDQTSRRAPSSHRTRYLGMTTSFLSKCESNVQDCYANVGGEPCSPACTSTGT